MPIPGGTGPALVTVTDVHAEINDTNTANDTEIQGFIDAATAVIENIVGPVLAVQYTEWHDGGDWTILLDRCPVLGVDTVTEYTPTAQALAAEPTDTTTTFTGYGYTVDLDIGQVTRTSSGAPYRFAQGRVQVVYTAGRASVPANIRQATLELIRHMWDTQRGGGGLRPVAGLDSEFPTEAPSAGYLVPNRVKELLEPDRRAPRIA